MYSNSPFLHVNKKVKGYLESTNNTLNRTGILEVYIWSWKLLVKFGKLLIENIKLQYKHYIAQHLTRTKNKMLPIMSSAD